MSYIYDMTDTWNAAGTVFSAIKMNVTNSASATGSKLIDLQLAGNSLFNVDKTGNVGIGTTEPSNQLSVAGNTTATISLDWTGDNAAKAWFSANHSTGEVRHAAVTNYFPTFYSNNSERMRIASDGRVGIGSTNPNAELQVYKNVANNPVITRVQQGSSGNPFDYATIAVTTTGVTGGVVAWSPGSIRAGSVWLQTDGAYPLVFGTNDTERARIDSSGNLGLGVTPSAWAAYKAIDINTGGLSLAGGNQSGAMSVGSYWDNVGGTWKYSLTTSYRPVLLDMFDGSFKFNVASAGGTAGNAISFTQAMTLDASGNLLVGTTTSTGGKLEVNGQSRSTSLDVTGALASFASAGGLAAYYNGSGAGVIRAYSNNAGAAGAITFNASGSENARISSSGDLLVGQSAGGFSNGNSMTLEPSAGYCVFNHLNGTASGTKYHYFAYNGGEIGSITQNGTTAVAYNTSSDYRLKDIAGPIQNSGAYIDALKPVQGSWKADGSRFIGLIAHEVQEVSETQIATGVKDGEEMQAMDYSAPELIANLIAEIQSLRARVAQLEGN